MEQALATVLAHATALPGERVALEDAEGRVLAEDARSDVDLPPFDRSAMDGFAVRVEPAGEGPALFPIVGRVKAGDPPGFALPAGRAVEIMTGAPVPQDATGVQQVEKTRLVDHGTTVELLEGVTPGQNVSPRGSEVRSGDRVLEAGTRIDSAVVGVLAAVGSATVAVGRRPRVAVVVTGDEIVDVAARPAPGQIRNSNGPAIAAQIRAAGGLVALAAVAPDEPEALARAIAAGLAHDVLVLSGGVSKGAYDLVEGVLERAGVELLFTEVSIKPGAPLVFGRRGATLVFGLPGNPVSSQVTFDLFARPALLKMQGASALHRPRVEAEVTAAVRNRSGRRAHLPVRLRFEGHGFVAEPLRSQGSADLAAHARANALLVLEADRTDARAGERLPALLLSNFLDR